MRRNEKDFEVTEKMFLSAIDSLLTKNAQTVLASFFDKKDGDEKCQSKK